MITPAAITPDIEIRLAQLRDAARARMALLEALIKTQPKAIACDRHNVQRVIDLDASERATFTAREPRVVYEPCPQCVAERKRREQDERLARFGVPSNMLHCDFENWKPKDKDEALHLATVKDFTRAQRGFLVLLGSRGSGKSHLAVAALRQSQNGLFVEQYELIGRLRARYNDRTLLDPVKDCQRAGLLVLDEFGLSSGGRDEMLMLHSILDHRYGERKPTVITSNLDWELSKNGQPSFKEVIGERLADRLRESAYVMLFNGKSHRPEARERYFGGDDLDKV